MEPVLVRDQAKLLRRVRAARMTRAPSSIGEEFSKRTDSTSGIEATVIWRIWTSAIRYPKSTSWLLWPAPVFAIILPPLPNQRLHVREEGSSEPLSFCRKASRAVCGSLLSGAYDSGFDERFPGAHGNGRILPQARGRKRGRFGFRGVTIFAGSVLRLARACLRAPRIRLSRPPISAGSRAPHLPECGSRRSH